MAYMYERAGKIIRTVGEVTVPFSTAARMVQARWSRERGLAHYHFTLIRKVPW